MAPVVVEMLVVDNVELDLVMVKVEGIWFLRVLEIVVMLVQDDLRMTLQEGSEQGPFGDQLA